MTLRHPPSMPPQAARHDPTAVTLAADGEVPPRPRLLPLPLPVPAHAGMAAQLRCLLGVSLVFLVAYWLSNRLTSTRTDIGAGVFSWERGIPFMPWTIVPYLSICGFFALSFFVGRDRHALARHTTRLLLALGIAIVCHAACPLRFTFERPLPEGLTRLLFQGLTAFDLPYNRAPSLHISVLLLWVHLVPHATGWLRTALQGWFVLIGISVLTTYQHHVIDVPAGFAVGALCIALTSQRRRWFQPVATLSRRLRSGQQTRPHRQR